MNRETGDLGTASLERARYRASLGAIAVEGQRLQGCGGEVDRIPFEDEGGLGCVSQTEDGRRWSLDTVGVQDTLLEGLEGSCVGALCGVVARNGDIDNAARGDVVWEENRGEFNLVSASASGIVVEAHVSLSQSQATSSLFGVWTRGWNLRGGCPG